MNRIIVTLIFVLCACNLFAQSKQPSWFIARLATLPGSASEFRQREADMRQLRDDIDAEAQKYKDLLSTKAASLSQADLARIQQQQTSAMTPQRAAQMQQDASDLMSIQQKIEDFDQRFKRVIEEYRNDFRKKVMPLDSMILSYLGNETGNESAKVRDLKKQRMSLWASLMNQYLAAPSGKFQVLLDEYLVYLRQTYIPYTDRLERERLSMLGIQQQTYTGSLESLRGYVDQYLHLIQNFEDYRDYQ